MKLKMLKQIAIYSLFILELTICYCYLEYGSLKIPDLSWTQTACVPSYGRWINLHNSAVFHDFGVSPYNPRMVCWVQDDNIRFSRPFFDKNLILQLYVILIFLNIILKRT